MHQKRRVTGNQKHLRPLSRHCGEGAIELFRTSCLHLLQSDAQRSGSGFHLFHLRGVSAICRVSKDGHAGGLRPYVRVTTTVGSRGTDCRSFSRLRVRTRATGQAYQTP